MNKYRCYSNEDKIQAVKDYLSDKRSIQQICEDLGINYQTNRGGVVRGWIQKYIEFGEEGLLKKKQRKAYTGALKIEAVEAYLNGEGSLADICSKYEICADSILRRWIKKYNNHIKLEDSDPSPEAYMVKPRLNTTLEERIAMVEYCINHENNYKRTIMKYSWVKRYKKDGPDGLIDRRGKRKKDNEIDELERLRRENERLRRQIQEQEMTMELLKKLQEFERS